MPLPNRTVTLDRRVHILQGQPEDAPPIERTSQLAVCPYVVLLAEPGMGKSTVLEQQANQAGGYFCDVRGFIDGAPVPGGRPLFLDSLDEYRSDSASAVEKLSAKLDASAAPRWWLSCRAVDWREPDLAVLRRVTNGAGIVVATLEPLDPEESDRIFAALTKQDPADIRQRADALAARAFLQNPLALRLLVESKLTEMPRSRFELFEAATEKLAHEFDERRSRNRVPLEVLAVASELCAYLLLANRAGLWHQNRPAPEPGGKDRYLATNALRMSSQQVDLALDTALFQRKGPVFAPMHRAIAEFLAGRALAHAVAGGKDEPRLPLGRILALMTAGGRPPTDLRGLYAWTAVHLSRLGLREEALRLISNDPVSVLVYGDAAVLTVAERKELWSRLDHDDPWFLANVDSDTAIGGLAGEDLVGEFEHELRRPDGVTHRYFAVTEALRYGPPIASLRPILYDIALDGERPNHERVRAAEAWLAGEPNADAGRLALFRAAAALPPADGHTLFRLRIAGELPPDALSDTELDQLLVDYAGSKESPVTGRLWTLSRKLQQSNRAALLTRDWHAVLEKEHLRGPTHEIRRLLDQLLVSALSASPAPSGKTVQKWLANVRPYFSQNLPDPVREAIQKWIQADTRRPTELLAAMAEAKSAPGSWPLSEYYSRTGGLPTMEVAIALLDPESSICRQLGPGLCREMVIELALLPGAHSAIRPAVLKRLMALPTTPEVLSDIALVEHGRPKAPALIEMEKHQAAHEAELDRRVRKVVAKFKRSVAALSDGSAPVLLNLAAQYHFGTNIHGATIEAGFDRVVEFVGTEVGLAIEAGWTKVARTLKLDPDELGKYEASLQTHFAEPSVLAGIDRMLATGSASLNELPLSAALVALKSSQAWAGNDHSAAERLSRWGLEHLAGAGAKGSAALSALWMAALGAGTKSPLPGSWVLSESPDHGRFAVNAVYDALSKYPDMNSNSLGQLLHAAAGVLPVEQLMELADAALQVKAIGGECHDLWICVAFALDPNPYRERFVATFAGRADELGEYFNLLSRIGQGWSTQRILIAKGVLEACARGEHDIYRGGNAGRASLALLQNSSDRLARIALELLAADSSIADAWRDDFRHALAIQARQWRDLAFAPPEPSAIEEALSGGAPVNAADLFAVVVEQLRFIQAELQTGPLNGWDSYWSEKPRTPKTENRCRDALARELQARLRHFGIDVPLQPEAQRAAETRADLLIVSNRGGNLPLEAKRHWNPEVWTAAGTQLQGYAADIGADRFGIYLVFWFGGYKPVMPRPDRRKPATAAEMEEMLRADLPENLKSRTEIIVLDVSNPKAVTRVASKVKLKARKRSIWSRRGA